MSRKKFYIRRSRSNLTIEQRIVASMKALRDVQAGPPRPSGTPPQTRRGSCDRTGTKERSGVAAAVAGDIH